VDSLVIDADGHVIEPIDLWQQRLPKGLRERSLIVNREDSLFQTISGLEVPPRTKWRDREEFRLMRQAVSGGRFDTPARLSYSAASTLDSMDVEGIDISMLFPTRGLFLMGVDDTVDPMVTTASAAVYNDWLAEYCDKGSRRLLGVAMIDPRDVDSAISEAHRAVNELDMVGVFIRPNPGLGRMWHDRVYDPLWAAIEDLDVPVCFHEGGGVPLPQVASDRFDRHCYWHVLTHPMEAQIAMVSIVLGGVTERFARLRFGFMESGASWLPYLMWRMDEAFANGREWQYPTLTMEPSDYVKRQCFVSIDPGETPGIAALHALDGGNVIWGTDYPHGDAKFPVAYKSLASITGMTPEFLSSIVYHNPLKLLGPVVANRIVR
jgi:predicted TIM-barrel fold metal-dependent hydrolase